MTRENGIYINREHQVFRCRNCNDRSFGSEHDLMQHCRGKHHSGEWCERCQVLFVSGSARNDHIKDSMSHWCCQTCNLDMTNRLALLSHHEKEHSFCLECGENFRFYAEHRIEKHNACNECMKEFGSQNELTMHHQVHLSRDKECYGCNRLFPTDSAILIHLESGTCSSGIDCGNVEKWAFQCYQHRHYTNDWDNDYRFRCPTCNTNFEYISALLQHIESPACPQGYDRSIAKLKHFLQVRSVSTNVGSDTS